VSEPIPSDVAELIRSRHGLLWTCQKFDLRPNQKTHGLDLKPTEAALGYREAPDATDRRLASLYWEAIWAEGAKPVMLSAIKIPSGSSIGRRVVVLASEADMSARVSSQEFLPVCVLPGLLDDTAPMDSRYGTLGRRARERVAWGLASRIRMHADAVLVVIGASEMTDLDFLYELIEERPFPGLRQIVVQPQDGVELNPPKALSSQAIIWRGVTGF
jgi:hypothetical protein